MKHLDEAMALLAGVADDMRQQAAYMAKAGNPIPDLDGWVARYDALVGEVESARVLAKLPGKDAK